MLVTMLTLTWMMLNSEILNKQLGVREDMFKKKKASEGIGYDSWNK
jgi:hypothetical protein